jgi:DNA-binding NtrC family response regulator
MSHPTAVLAIADPSLRQRLGAALAGLRWSVIEAAGGAEALAQLENHPSEAVIIDPWFPDLDVKEFFREVQSSYPEIDLISVDGSLQSPVAARSGRHGELMHAIRLSQEWDGAAYLSAVDSSPERGAIARLAPGGLRAPMPLRRGLPGDGVLAPASSAELSGGAASSPPASAPAASAARPGRSAWPAEEVALPELLGNDPAMLEVSRRVRLVAQRATPVLVQGPSGTGKELVARAIHRLSPRAHRPFVVLNCAAIPESLLEAELFGHTRGAFTGAVQGRIGRIESANGGTLFLDEIGEMPLALQAKLLRFLEAGEIQRVGDNGALTVDVRVVAATHQALARRVRQGAFREDVYYRLAVFLIKTPALRDHPADIPLLAQFFLRRLCETSPRKHLADSALERLARHRWPGNVRELAHVIERAYILAESRAEVLAEDIEFEDIEFEAGEFEARGPEAGRLAPGRFGPGQFGPAELGREELGTEEVGTGKPVSSVSSEEFRHLADRSRGGEACRW